MELEALFENTFPFWKELSPEDKEHLVRNSANLHFEKKQEVHGNSECSGVFIVKTGKLRIYMLSEEGKEITLYRLTHGELCMLSASCVLKTITFDVFVEAEIPTECCVISGIAFAEISEKYSSAKIFALETAVARFSDVMWIMQQALFMAFDKRLAGFLLEEMSSENTETIVMTHEQIANHLGSAREVVSRMLKLFAADGIVEVSRKGITVKDKSKLRKIAY